MENDQLIVPTGMDDLDLKQQVKQFYNQVGWQVVSDGVYQNASYEDLRPVSYSYIHRCHLRVGRFLKPAGRYLLDAGSGPIQYPEYLTYSQGYAYRVCADISIVALIEARKRLGEKGLYVVADVANLPFKAGVFEGAVSLHTLHHLTPRDHQQAYLELHRVLQPGSSGIIVNGWKESWLMAKSNRLVTWMERRKERTPNEASDLQPPEPGTTGTYVFKYDAAWLRTFLDGKMGYEIRVWRTVTVRFLRAVIQPWLGGRLLLWILFRLEEIFPHYFGEKGAYPLIIIHKEK